MRLSKLSTNKSLVGGGGGAYIHTFKYAHTPTKTSRIHLKAKTGCCKRWWPYNALVGLLKIKDLNKMSSSFMISISGFLVGQ